MDNSLIAELMGQLQGASAGAMARQLGADAETTSDAIAAALPMIVGALGRNARQADGAQALLGALQRDHGGAGAMDPGALLGSMLGAGQAGGAGGLGGLLGSMLGGGAPASRQLDAGGILGHVFGTAQPRAEAGLSQATGLDAGQAGKLLMMLAPMVMAALGRRVSAGGLDAGGLSSTLGQEHQRIQQQGGLAGGLLGAVLDQDGDGKVDVSDLLKIGGSLLGGGRR